jgi:hypothetical protein
VSILLGALVLVLIGATSYTWNFVHNTTYTYFFQQLTTYMAFFAAPAAALLAIRAIWDAGKQKK